MLIRLGLCAVCVRSDEGQIPHDRGPTGDIDVRPEPLLNGHDLIRLGATPGPSLGQLAEELYTAQLEGSLKTPANARRWAAQWLKKHETDQ